MWTMLHLSGFEPCAGGGDGEVLSDSSGSSRGCSPHGVRDEEGPAAISPVGQGSSPRKMAISPSNIKVFTRKEMQIVMVRM